MQDSINRHRLPTAMQPIPRMNAESLGITNTGTRDKTHQPYAATIRDFLVFIRTFQESNSLLEPRVSPRFPSLHCGQLADITTEGSVSYTQVVIHFDHTLTRCRVITTRIVDAV